MVDGLVETGGSNGDDPRVVGSFKFSLTAEDKSQVTVHILGRSVHSVGTAGPSNASTEATLRNAPSRVGWLGK